jgi:hypothetical protein
MGFDLRKLYQFSSGDMPGEKVPSPAARNIYCTAGADSFASGRSPVAIKMKNLCLTQNKNYQKNQISEIFLFRSNFS